MSPLCVVYAAKAKKLSEGEKKSAKAHDILLKKEVCQDWTALCLLFNFVYFEML